MSKGRSYKKTKGEFRDTTRFVIAVEGAKREVQYFETLVDGQRRIKVKVVKPLNNQSAPGRVLDQLKAFAKTEGLLPDDVVWMVVDTDRWSERQLMSVHRACKDKGWALAISNPCFELWLYLHYAELPKDYKGSCQQLKTDLGQITTPSGYQVEKALELLNAAIERAEVLDSDAELVLPPVNVTQVYRVVTAMKVFFEE